MRSSLDAEARGRPHRLAAADRDDSEARGEGHAAVLDDRYSDPRRADLLLLARADRGELGVDFRDVVRGLAAFFGAGVGGIDRDLRGGIWGDIGVVLRTVVAAPGD